MKKIFPHVFVFFAFITLVLLGTWQVERRVWKQEVMDKIDARINSAPMTHDFGSVQDSEFKRVSLNGKFHHDKEILILNKPFNGKQGQWVFTPFESTVGTFMVNRGWVPTDAKIDQPAEFMTIEGVIRGTQKPNWLGKMITLENKPGQKIWFWIDLPKMYESLGLRQENFYVEETGETVPNHYPYPLPTKPSLYNEHLQYAVTWYSLAGILLVVYYFRFWASAPRHPGEGRDLAEGDSRLRGNDKMERGDDGAI